MPSATSVADIRMQAGRLCRIVAAGAIVLWVLLVLERFGAPTADLLQHGGDAGLCHVFALRLLEACPQAIYLIALEWTRRALAGFARGDLFAPTVAHMLDRVGATLALGAVVELVLVPAAQRLLGSNPGYWIAFDVSALVLAAIGLSLSVVARVLQRAADLQTELDEIF